MKLDVIVPTYNRSKLLQRTLASLLEAPIPAGLDVTILVIDNNSTDDTPAAVQQLALASSPASPRTLRYVREEKQGLSNARNAGILSGSAELLGFVDDDEEIGEQWFDIVAREFTDPNLQFIGGPYLPNWEAPRPAWLPSSYNGVIGVTVESPRMPYGPAFPGNLNGGNAIVRRSAYDQVGLYDPRLGRGAKGLLSEEDAEFYRRLLAAGLPGIYVPDLVIYHHIPAARLTRAYYRRWCFWRGISHGVASRDLREPVPHLLGLPRYRVRAALLGLLALPRNLSSTGGSGGAFAQELALWDLLGFLRGRYFTRVASLYSSRA